MNGFVIVSILFIGLVKWYKSKDLVNKMCAMSLTLSGVFLIIRQYIYRPGAAQSGFEIIFVYALCLIIYYINLIQGAGEDE